MSEYKEELSALVEKIRQDGAKEERRRIAEKLADWDFCVLDIDKNANCINDCVEHFNRLLNEADNV